jgi:hypothetical protein
MTVNEILAQLESLGDDARRAHNTKAGAPDNQFGVKLGDIRAMAKRSRLITNWRSVSGTPATSRRSSSPRSSSSPGRSPPTNSTS